MERENTIYILQLKEPYWGAKKRYKWEYGDSVGFGVDVDILNSVEEVLIQTKWGDYMVNVKDVKPVHDKYNLLFNRKGKKLVIIPRAICRKVEDAILK